MIDKTITCKAEKVLLRDYKPYYLSGQIMAESGWSLFCIIISEQLFINNSPLRTPSEIIQAH